MSNNIERFAAIYVIGWFSVLGSFAQFEDHFERVTSPADNGWATATGDGTIAIEFIQKNGYASIEVDATRDQRNIWWAVIRHPVPQINVKKLMKPENELRAEVRIRVSHAPRRVNLHFNHQRTTDFHSHLMEYDIPDTSWHTISLTTKDFDARPGDLINVQMALMDWGLAKYQVDIDYFKVSLVNARKAPPDQGAQLPYHPPIASQESFRQSVPVLQDAMIDVQFPDLNFNNWSLSNNGSNLLTVSGTQLVILRWDLSEFRDESISKSGLLELTVHTVQRSPDFNKDFGMIRISEIIAGDPNWDQQNVTMNSFCRHQPLENVINTQMTIDSEVAPDHGGKAYFTVSYPVLQRLIAGKTLGLAIQPLGAVLASFYPSETQNGPKLYFDTDQDP